MNIVLTKNKTPFRTEAAAARAMKAAGIHSEIVEIDGGFGYRNVASLGTDTLEARGRAYDSKLKDLGKKLFKAGVQACAGRNYQNGALLTLLADTLNHAMFNDSPLSAFVAVATRQKTVVGGGEYGEDIEVPMFDTRDIIFGLESVFQAAVSRICSAQRRHEAELRVLARTPAKAKEIVDEDNPTDLQGMERQDRDPLGDYVEALDVLHIECAQVWDAYASRYERAQRHTLPFSSEVVDSIIGERAYAFDFETARGMSDRYAANAKRSAQLDARARAQALHLSM